MSKVKIKFLGVNKVKRYYKAGNISCDTNHKETCIVEIEAEQAAQITSDFPNEWEFIEKDGAEMIGKEITEYQNKMVAQVSSTKGIKIIETKSNLAEKKAEPETVEVKKPVKPKKPVRKPKKSRRKK